MWRINRETLVKIWRTSGTFLMHVCVRGGQQFFLTLKGGGQHFFLTESGGVRHFFHIFVTFPNDETIFLLLGPLHNYIISLLRNLFL